MRKKPQRHPAPCSTCGRLMLGRTAFDQRHYCQKCYGLLEQADCSRCGGSIRFPTGLKPKLCSRCTKSLAWKGQTCVRCNRTIRKSGFHIDGRNYCANCSKYGREPIACSLGCGSVTHTAAPCPSLGFKSPICRRCLNKHMEYCRVCRQKRIIAGVLEGYPACKACLSRGTLLRGTCSTCGKVDDAPNTGRCLGCRSIQVAEASVRKLADALSQDWVKGLFLGYAYANPDLARTRPMQIYTLVKRNADAFLRIDQNIKSPGSLTAVNVLRAFGSDVSASRFKSVKNWLSASHGLDFHSDEVSWFYYKKRIKALKESIDQVWILESVRGFENHLLKRREQLIQYSLKGGRRKPTKADTILLAIRFSSSFLSYCASAGVTSINGVNQSHVDTYIARNQTQLNSLASFVKYLNRGTHRAFHLDVPTRRKRANMLSRTLSADAKKSLIHQLLACTSWSDTRNATAAVICLFYPVTAARVLSLKKESIQTIDGVIHVDFGSGPLPTDPPISTMISNWLTNWHWHSRMRNSVSSEFLFPGATPSKGYSVSAFRIWLSRLGVTKTQLFATAVHGLISAGLSNPGMLVDLFGMSVDSAMRYWYDSCADAESHLNKSTIEAYREQGLLSS